MSLLKPNKLLMAGALAAALLGATTAQAKDTPQEARNKKTALAMWQAVIVEGNADAVLRYMAPGYIQHNPLLAQGRDALYQAIKSWKTKKTGDHAPGPHTNSRLIHAFADGDMVALTWYQDEPDPADPTKTYTTGGFDMFRFDRNGKIAEHWDAVRKTK